MAIPIVKKLYPRSVFYILYLKPLAQSRCNQNAGVHQLNKIKDARKSLILPIQPFITLKNVTVRLRDKTFLRDTSWQINYGENWAILGPNGAGKTTLGKALADAVPVVKGRIRRHYKKPAAKIAANGIIYVSPDQHRDILAKENLLLDSRDFSGNIHERTTVHDIISEQAYGRTCNYKENDQRLNRVVNRLQIGSILDRNILSISTGEMAKTLIARALMHHPQLLVLDEPFEGLDIQSRRVLQELLRQLMHNHLQIVLITQRLDELMPDITHVIFLRGGRVYRSGPKENVLTPKIVNSVYATLNHPNRHSQKLQAYIGALPNKKIEKIHTRGTNQKKILIRLRDTTVRYGDIVVLDNINWTVKGGENWMISGPNGSGKTTLLKLITGDNLQAYANDIYLFGKKKGSGENVWEIKQNLGFISPELQARYPAHLSAFDVICSGFFDSIGLYRLCRSWQQNSARKWIEIMGLEDLAVQKFGLLSHGQRQLILIARAMVKTPPVLMLDEPCDGLDPANRDKLLKILNFIGLQTPTNLIYITHRPEESLACITHILHLKRGKIIQVQKNYNHDVIGDSS